MPGTQIDTLLRDFQLHLKLQGRSEATAVLYRRAVRQLAAHAGVHDPAELTREHVMSWAVYMAEKGMAPATRRVRLLGVRVFLEWCVQEPGTGVKRNVAERVPLPAVPTVPREIPDVQDIRTLLRSMRARTFLGTRDTLITLVLLDTGLRRSELAAVDVADVDEDRQLLVVRAGKGGRWRRVAYGNQTALALARYLRFRRLHVACDQPALLLSTRPDRDGSYRLTPGGVALILKRRCADAGIRQITPHQLRHWWADRLARSGLRETEMTFVGGWSERSVQPKLYGRALVEERALEAQRRASPVQRLLDPAE